MQGTFPRTRLRQAVDGRRLRCRVGWLGFLLPLLLPQPLLTRPFLLPTQHPDLHLLLSEQRCDHGGSCMLCV